jgi:hypothetical protein
MHVDLYLIFAPTLHLICYICYICIGLDMVQMYIMLHSVLVSFVTLVFGVNNWGHSSFEIVLNLYLALFATLAFFAMLA